MNYFKESIFMKEVSFTFVSRIFIFIMLFFSSIITARYLGPGGKGILAVLATITAIATQFGNFGLHVSNTYFVAKDKSKLDQVIKNTFIFSILAGLLISFLIVVFFFIRHDLAKGIPYFIFIIVALSIPFNLLFMLSQNILLGLERIKLFNILELTKETLTFFLIILLLVFLNKGVISVIFIGIILTVLFSLITIKKLNNISGDSAKTFDIILFQDMFRYGVKAYLAAFLAFLVIRFDILMVNYFLSSKDTGIYSIAVNMTDFIYMLPMTIGMIFFPRVSSMKKGSWMFTKKVFYMTAFIIFCISFCSWFLIKFVVFLFYGDSFLGAIEAFRWLLPGIFFLSINTILMNFLASKGMPLIVIFSPFLALIINIIFNFYLIRKLGINGAAFSSSVAYLVMFIMSITYISVKKEIRHG